MKLWVDDVRDAPDDSWTEVRKAEQAIVALAKFRATEISLDHDIENRPSDETFKAVAYFIGVQYSSRLEWDENEEDYIPSWSPKVTIHSMNPVGAQQIHDILKGYGLVATIKPYSVDN